MNPLFVETLQLNNYRNFKNKTLSFHQCNIITGDVATGKTNILEALTVFLSVRISNIYVKEKYY